MLSAVLIISFSRNLELYFIVKEFAAPFFDAQHTNNSEYLRKNLNVFHYEILIIDILHSVNTDNTINTDSTERRNEMFLLNLQSKVPIYEQIQNQILKFIQAGVLKPGDKLPSVRQLAIDNGINPNTVAKAYTELEKNGFVYNLPKKGVYVAEIDKSTSRSEMIRNVLKPLKDSGVEKGEIIHVLNDLFPEDSIC